MQVLPLHYGQVEKSPFHGRYHRSGIGTLESRSFAAVVVSCAVQKCPKIDSLFGGRRLPGGVGTRRGGGQRNSIMPGCPEPLSVFKSLCLKKFVLIFLGAHQPLNGVWVVRVGNPKNQGKEDQAR